MKKYKLGELIEISRGASLSGDFYAASGKYIRLTCGNFDYHNNCFKENTSKDNLYYTGEFRTEFLLDKGDLITPLTEQAIGLLGSTAWIPESGKYIQSQDIAKITCKEELLDKKFVYYLISSNMVKQQLGAAAQQTKIRHTSPDKIKDCTVWLPSLAEQKQIGQLLFDIDRKIEINRAINHNLEAMAKQLYDYWFVQFDFPDENSKPYKSSGGKMVWNEKQKREIPEGWNIVFAKDVCPIITGKEDANFSTTHGQYPFFTCAKENLFCDTYAFDESSILIAGNGDFNVKHYTGKFNAYQRTYVLTPNPEYYACLFFAANSKIGQFKDNSNGSIIKFITKGDVENIELYKSENKHLYNTLNSLLFSIEQNNQEISSLAKLRDEMAPLLMNGQVKAGIERSRLNYDLSAFSSVFSQTILSIARLAVAI